MRHKDTEYSFLKWWIHFDVWQKFKNKIKLKKKNKEVTQHKKTINKIYEGQKKTKDSKKS